MHWSLRNTNWQHYLLTHSDCKAPYNRVLFEMNARLLDESNTSRTEKLWIFFCKTLCH